MKNRLKSDKIILILMIVLVSMMLLIGCSGKSNENKTEEPVESQEEANESNNSQYITVEEAKAYYSDEDYVFVDARLSDAYNGWALDGVKRGGHIPGAVDFPYNWLTVDVDNSEEQLTEALEIKGILKEKNIIVYATNDKHALLVHDYLDGKGFEKVSMFDLNLWVDDNSLALDKLENYKKIVPASIVKSILDGEKPETFETSKSIKVVEASWGPEDSSYTKGHVPGTVHINTDLVEPEPEWMLAGPALLKEFVLDYGFTKEDTVIVTGAEQMAAYRVAIVLDYIGVKDTRVLNGGLDAWKQAGYTVETESHKPEAVNSFGGEIPENEDVIMTIDELKIALESDKNFTLVDNRTWEEFIGESSGYSYHDKKGRIPGAVYGYAGIENSYSLDYFRNIDKTMRNPEEIKALWLEQGIDLENHLAFMCGSGWRAAEIFMYAQVMGLEDTSLYSDGWIGWSNDTSNPTVTGVPK